jgi:hypothetical protein
MLELQLILNYRGLRKIAASGFKALAEAAVPDTTKIAVS